MASDTNVHLVKAVHNFKGSNNDELCFKKGDIVTVTQVLDGGWWEGTLNDVTGWFPSNYVKELRQDSKSAKSPTHSQDISSSTKLDSMKMYRGIVFKDIVDTESNHLNEMKNLVNNFLNPLSEKSILSDDEYLVLKNNIDEVCEMNSAFLHALEDIQEKSQKDQKIGGIFMHYAPQLKSATVTYSSNHPNAAAIVEKHKEDLEKFMEENGAPSPGILILTTGLSRPFRRLEKYPALLQELQRHTEESHIDRGDTHRAIFVYRDIASACLNIRRQKETELEVMSGNIKGWEGEPIQTLGNIVHLGLVVFLTENQERKDRYLIAFPQNLVILALNPNASSFVYEGKLPTSGISVQKLDACDTYQHAFEITGSMIQRIIVICSSKESLEQWLSILKSSVNATKQMPSPVMRNVSNMSPHVSLAHKSMPSTALSAITPSPQQSPGGNVPILEDRSPVRITPTHRINNKVWTSWCLRPHPPLRPTLIPMKGDTPLRRSNSRRKEKLPDEKNYEGDMKILQVIEAYCTSAKSRYTVNSALLDLPPVLIAEDEKIIVEEFQGNSLILEEKSLVDTVYSLKDQIQELKEETNQLFKYFDDEKNARMKLELILQKHVLEDCKDSLSTYFHE